MTTVAYLGPAGTFTEQALLQFAARGCFGSANDFTTLPVDSPNAALAAVAGGQATHAVVAIENSVDGAVTSTFDALHNHPTVQIIGETAIDIAFTIMARQPIDPATITTFATHPVAHRQVASWLAQHAPNATFLPATSNAAAAHLVAEGKADAAAAPPRAAELTGLVPLAEGIADVAGARTRFVLCTTATTPAPPTALDRTSVEFVLPNTPGSLVGALQEFATRGVDLTCIESRPTRESLGTYRFHADLIGHITDPEVSAALAALYNHCTTIRFLGSWSITEASPTTSRTQPNQQQPQPIDHNTQTGDQWVASLLQ
ncbi:prephenate dehydratase [Corynebacterium choanae]|nr:prephenate dehydratase [Corynebacterium choanae]